MRTDSSMDELTELVLYNIKSKEILSASRSERRDHVPNTAQH